VNLQKTIIRLHRGNVPRWKTPVTYWIVQVNFSSLPNLPSLYLH